MKNTLQADECVRLQFLLYKYVSIYHKQIHSISKIKFLVYWREKLEEYIQEVFLVQPYIASLTCSYWLEQCIQHTSFSIYYEETPDGPELPDIFTWQDSQCVLDPTKIQGLNQYIIRLE